MNWDRETDVVVIGYGSAGAMAAVAAHDAGARVLILEKMAEAGGATRTSGGRMRVILDPEKAIEFFFEMCERTTPRDILEVLVREGVKIPEMVRNLGGEAESVLPEKKFYPHPTERFPLPGSESIAFNRYRVKGPVATAADTGGGANVMSLLIRNVTARKIEALYETPAVKLITGDQGGVIGVEASCRENRMKIKARRGVILASGGFGANREMLKNYVGQSYYQYYCNPGNTGDGIKMAMEIGADLWHMSAIVASFAYVIPECEYPIRHRMSSPGYLYVDQRGRRFMNEMGTDSHWMWTQVSQWNSETMSYLRAPCFVIYDDDTFRGGSVGSTSIGKAGDIYQWSDDNEAELEKGWIIQADDIDVLANKLNIIPNVLQETISRYNHYCVGGYDPEYHRKLQTLVPIVRPPFYAGKILPTLYNTLGGPRRDRQARVLHVGGSPIPRLYSAGELGSLWDRNYIGAGNVLECMVFGKIAGKNAAAEVPWDAATKTHE
ncbi:MAG: FAD-dependent oxidoreductase [Thermodesulfobacteriota bacterium]